MLCLFLFILGSSVSASGSVKLTEIMFDPAGSEIADEYIEVQNVGSAAVELTGWSVGEGRTTEEIVPLGSAALAPGQFGLILDPDYSVEGGIYGPLGFGINKALSGFLNGETIE